jgi:hypothetical protein
MLVAVAVVLAGLAVRLRHRMLVARVVPVCRQLLLVRLLLVVVAAVEAGKLRLEQHPLVAVPGVVKRRVHLVQVLRILVAVVAVLVVLLLEQRMGRMVGLALWL